MTTDKILIDQMGSGNACALLRDGAVIDLFGDPPRKNISKDQINFGSVFYAKIERDSIQQIILR